MEDERFVIKENKDQYGVFSKASFKIGEKIIDFSGEIMDKFDLPDILLPEHDRYVQIDIDKYMGPSGGFDDYFNHSCDPNSGLVIDEKDVYLVAIKNIKIGEEIVWDYSTTMFDEKWTLECECGSGKCRKIVRNFKELPLEIKQRYKDLGIIPYYNMTQ